MKILLFFVMLFTLAGCAGLPASINTVNTDTLSARQAAHAVAVSQAKETLREAAEWQQLNTPTALIAAAPPVPSNLIPATTNVVIPTATTAALPAGMLASSPPSAAALNAAPIGTVIQIAPKASP